MIESRQSYCHKHRVPFFGPPCSVQNDDILLPDIIANHIRKLGESGGYFQYKFLGMNLLT